MKRLSIYILSLIAAALPAAAQQPKFAEWDPHPTMHAVPPKYFNEHAIMVLNSVKCDYKFSGNDIWVYTTTHRIIKVLDKTGVEAFNRVEIPLYAEIDSIKARTIIPDGKTREINYEMINMSRANNGMPEILFALDDVQKDAEIEYVVKETTLFQSFGSLHFQYPIPVLNTFFEMSYPKELGFEFKGFHGFPTLTDSLYGGRKHVNIYKANIPTLEEQPYSFYDLYRMRLDYRFSFYTDRQGVKRKEYTYNDAAKDLYTRFYKFTRKDTLAVTRFFASIKLTGNENEMTKIRMIEDGIKSSITHHDEVRGKDGTNLDTILLRKVASNEGIMKLFAASLSMAGVNHEFGATSNRKEHPLDVKFADLDDLDWYVIYFPSQGGYLAPTEPYFRYPLLPDEVINNKGVFTKTSPETGYQLGREVTEEEAFIRTIAPLSPSTSSHNMVAHVTFESGMVPEVKLTYSYTGYGTAGRRRTLLTTSESTKKDYIRNIIGFAKRPEQLLSYSTENEAVNSVYNNKPLQIKATVTAPNLLEKAGKNYILKIGQVIGQQTRLHPKPERVLPVDIDYPYSETRTIVLDIPKGMKVLNLNALKKKAEHLNDKTGEAREYFVSDYQLNGDRLTITINESYPTLHYPLREYHAFEEVVNASADFSELSLLLGSAK